MPKLPIIFDIAVVAQSTGAAAIGEAPRFIDHETPSVKMTSEEQEMMLFRVKMVIEEFIGMADRRHKEIAEERLDCITRLSTNEFFFYTQEPLTLEQFAELQNQIMQRAEMASSDVHLILSSFAVKTLEGKLMNVTVHLQCGEEPTFKFIVKNYTSSRDYSYEVIDEDLSLFSIPPLDKDTIADSTLPTIKIGEHSSQLTFNNLIYCRAPGGTSFITAIDVCVDHDEQVAKKNFITLVESDPQFFFWPVSHVVVSNSIRVKSENSIVSRVTQADPLFSPQKYKEGCEQEASINQKYYFGRSYCTVLYFKRGEMQLCSASVIDLKKQLQLLRKHDVRERILADFREKIIHASSQEELGQLRDQLQSSPEYSVLKSSSLFKAFTGKKSEAEVSLERLFREQEEHISPRPSHS